MTNSVHWKLKKNEYSIYQAIKKKKNKTKPTKKKRQTDSSYVLQLHLSMYLFVLIITKQKSLTPSRFVG